MLGHSDARGRCLAHRDWVWGSEKWNDIARSWCISCYCCSIRDTASVCLSVYIYQHSYVNVYVSLVRTRGIHVSTAFSLYVSIHTDRQSRVYRTRSSYPVVLSLTYIQCTSSVVIPRIVSMSCYWYMCTTTGYIEVSCPIARYRSIARGIVVDCHTCPRTHTHTHMHIE